MGVNTFLHSELTLPYGITFYPILMTGLVMSLCGHYCMIKNFEDWADYNCCKRGLKKFTKKKQFDKELEKN